MFSLARQAHGRTRTRVADPDGCRAATGGRVRGGEAAPAPDGRGPPRQSRGARCPAHRAEWLPHNVRPRRACPPGLAARRSRRAPGECRNAFPPTIVGAPCRPRGPSVKRPDWLSGTEASEVCERPTSPPLGRGRRRLCAPAEDPRSIAEARCRRPNGYGRMQRERGRGRPRARRSLGEQFSKALCAFPPIWAIHLPLQTLYVGPFVGAV